MKRTKDAIVEPCGLTFAQLSALSDEHVMAHVQKGHDDALAVIFDRYHRLVLSIAFRILRDLGEAEDLTQTVFLQIFEAAGQFDPSRGTTKVWILQYAYHRGMNRRLYLTRRNFYDPHATSEEDLDLLEQGPIHNGAGSMPVQEVRRLVREGLEGLKKCHRRTLEMVYFEGMSLREVAEKTGESLGNVRHHYYRGLSQLRFFVSSGNPTGNGKEKAEFIRPGAVDVKT